MIKALYKWLTYLLLARRERFVPERKKVGAYDPAVCLTTCDTYRVLKDSIGIDCTWLHITDCHITSSPFVEIYSFARDTQFSRQVRHWEYLPR